MVTYRKQKDNFLHQNHLGFWTGSQAGSEFYLQDRNKKILLLWVQSPPRHHLPLYLPDEIGIGQWKRRKELLLHRYLDNKE